MTRTSRFVFLGELLVDQGFITDKQLEVAIAEQKRRGERLGTILIQSGFCTERDMAQALATQLNLPLVEVTTESIDAEMAGIFEESFLRQNTCIPIKGEAGTLTLALDDPFNMNAVDTVEELSSVPVNIVVAPASEIVQAIDALAAGSCKVDAMLAGVSAEAKAEGRLRDEVSTEELVHNIIAGGIQRGATDIHIEPDGNVLRVRYRIDGILQQGPMVDRELSASVIARVKVISNLDIAEQRLPQDGRARIEIDGAGFDLRISILPTVIGENVVMRVLDSRTAMLPPTALGLSERNYAPVIDVTTRPHGIMLVTGPTGSGKSTTLYSLLGTINALEKKVITVEDPVEYMMPLVRQVQAHTEIGMTFAAALRSMLRQDPDVILVGEIRDLETAQISIRAALTGHLVFSTLHTNTAIGTIPRLVDMGIDSFLLKSCLCGVLAQRLVRRNCKHCTEEYAPTDEEIATFNPELQSSIRTLARGVGCDRCAETGFAGRTAIHEFFQVTDRIRAIDLGGTPEPEILELAVQDGFRPMSYDGETKVIAGETTLTEIMRVAMLH